MMHPACSQGGRRPRLRWAVLLVLAAYFHPPPLAKAATCLPSAEAVRKAHPDAWPKWTVGSNGERCWYSGDKPVFARAPLQLVPVLHKPASKPKSRVAAEPDGVHSPAVPQPWALEHRWAEIFRYVD
jgi:hypothetical protein